MVAFFYLTFFYDKLSKSFYDIIEGLIAIKFLKDTNREKTLLKIDKVTEVVIYPYVT